MVVQKTLKITVKKKQKKKTNQLKNQQSTESFFISTTISKKPQKLCHSLCDGWWWVDVNLSLILNLRVLWVVMCIGVSISKPSFIVRNLHIYKKKRNKKWKSEEAEFST